VDLSRYEIKTSDGGNYTMVPVGENTAGLLVVFQAKNGIGPDGAIDEAKTRIENAGGTVTQDTLQWESGKALRIITEEGRAYASGYDGGTFYIGVSVMNQEAGDHFARIEAILSTISLSPSLSE
jgi:hypothetical protein